MSETGKMRRNRCYTSPTGVAFFGVLVLLCLSSCKPPQPKAVPNPLSILILCVDTLRADHTGLYGYHRPTTPNVDQFFSEGTVFNNAYSTASYTTPAVFSLLTGLSPQQHGIRILYQQAYPELDSLPRQLSRLGYQTAAIVSNQVLTAEASALDQHFDYYDDTMETPQNFSGLYERNAEGTTDAALRWLAAFRKPERPFLLYVHYMDPHDPYDPPDNKPVTFSHTGSLAFDPEEKVKDSMRRPGVTDALDYVDRYDEEIAYADEQIGRLLKMLQEKGLLDSLLVIFCADHGETLMEHEKWFRHSYHIYEEQVRIPLAIRGPEFQKSRVDELVSLLEIAPMIRSTIGLQENSPGRRDSLPPDCPWSNMLHVESDLMLDVQWRGLVGADKKWMVALNHKDPEKKILDARHYDLAKDPGEQNPIRPEKKNLSEQILPQLLQLIQSDPDLGRPYPVKLFAKGTRLTQPKGFLSAHPGLTEEQIRKLQAIGYLHDIQLPRFIPSPTPTPTAQPAQTQD